MLCNENKLLLKCVSFMSLLVMAMIFSGHAVQSSDMGDGAVALMFGAMAAIPLSGILSMFLSPA